MIPFCKTTLGEEEKKAICDVIDGGWVVMGNKTKEFENSFSEYVGAKHAVFVDSCTSALDLSVKYLIQSGIWSKEQVAVPSLTFTASAEVIVNNGLWPIFTDVDKKSFTMIPTNISQQLGVHITGNVWKADNSSCPMQIEDSAHRIDRGQCIGNPNLVCFSFYATKNMTTIQGGMICVNDDAVAAWLRKARDHGISKGTTERYKDGAWAYSIDFIGWRKKSDDVHAAIGIEQLKKLDTMQERRLEIISLYNRLLGLERTGLHVYPILMEKRPQAIEFLKENGIQCSVHFLPLHKMPGYQEYTETGSEISLPVTEYLGEHLVSLPLFPQLTDEEIHYISGKVKESKLLIQE